MRRDNDSQRIALGTSRQLERFEQIRMRTDDLAQFVADVQDRIQALRRVGFARESLVLDP